MLINLSNVLSDKDRVEEIKANIEMDSFKSEAGEYPFVNDRNVDFRITSIGKRMLLLEGTINCSLNIPCGRCLEYVTNDFKIKVSKEMDLSKSEDIDEDREELQYIEDGKIFDVDKFVYNEILIRLPMKVLCSSDCKGICYRCGTNLNKGTCDCDTKELDPRMAKVLDIFDQFKEV